MRVRIFQSASRDLVEGFHFYEHQQEGLGAYFFDSLSADIDSLQLYAGIHSVHFGRYHRMLSRRFPFAIYYRVHEEAAIVHAVLDCRRAPAWIRDRLG